MPQTTPDGHWISADGLGQVATGTDGRGQSATVIEGHAMTADGHLTTVVGRHEISWVAHRTIVETLGHAVIGMDGRGQARLIAASASTQPNP